MRTIIAGGRNICRIADVLDAIRKSGFEITEVVSGGARGVDEIGEWAAANYFDTEIPVKHFPADWEKYGRTAGPIRNRQMADYAEALILVWDGKSPGSRNMLGHAIERNLKIYQYIVETK